MKKSILLACLLTTSFLGTTLSQRQASAASAQTPWVRVEYINANATSADPNQQLLNWFMLVGVTSAGSCPKTDYFGSPRVLFAVQSDDRGKQQMSILEAAMLSGKSVQVNYDPSVLAGGACLAQSILIK